MSDNSQLSCLPARGHVPALSSASELGPDVDILLIPAVRHQERVSVPSCRIVTESVAATLTSRLESVGFDAAPGSFQLLPLDGELPAKAVGVVGIGAASDDDAPSSPASRSSVITAPFSASPSRTEVMRRAFGSAARSLPKGRSVAVATAHVPTEDVTIALALGAYSYTGLRHVGGADKPAPQTITSLVVLTDDAPAFERAAAIVEAVTVARDLVNTPSSHLYPESYAAFVEAEASKRGLDVEVLDEDALRTGGYGGICAVGYGSSRGPRLVRLTWSPENPVKTVALVGKGVTFDTGGISLKPGASMSDMISDMGGSAAMIATVFGAAALSLPVKVVATIPMAENMPGGHAYRPGDVVTHYGGMTSEIHNTDAEGRLILCDALVRACEDNPDVLIDSATLTGAQLVALGTRTSGVMGDAAVAHAIVEAGSTVGEPAWYMPIPEEVAQEFTSSSADLRNIGTSRNAGMMQAAYFLSEFVAEGVPWAHIDIAGPAYNTGSPFGYVSSRGTGVPVRTLLTYLTSLAGGEHTDQ